MDNDRDCHYWVRHSGGPWVGNGTIYLVRPALMDWSFGDHLRLIFFLFIHYWGVRKLEIFFALLILTMAITFIANMVGSSPDYG